MNEQILVLASKNVGLETVKFLVEKKTPIAFVIIVNDTDEFNRKLINFLRKNDIPYRTYTKNTQEEIINSKQKFDWILNLWSPHILNPKFLERAKHRLNIHSGLVPVNRGNDNAAWCIRLGIPAGVSFLEMNKEVDAGDVYIQKEVSYTFPTTGIVLHARIQQAAIALFKKSWPKIYAGRVRPQKQSGKMNYFTRHQTDQDRLLEGTTKMSVSEVVSRILAHDFYPGTTAQIRYNGKIYKVRATVRPSK